MPFKDHLERSYVSLAIAIDLEGASYHFNASQSLLSLVDLHHRHWHHWFFLEVALCCLGLERIRD